MRQTLRYVAALLMLLLGTCPVLLSQSATGTITGRVSDASGGVVPGSAITVKNVGTAQIQSVETGGSGEFTVPFLPPGVYQVTATKPGFKTFTKSGITLQVNQISRADCVLQVGQVGQTVSVSAAAVELDTDSSTVGQVVTGRQITQLPLNGRDFTQLLLLAPGAANLGGGLDPGKDTEISIGGARAASNGFLIDGTNNNEIYYNSVAINLSIDAIQEFKEQTKTYSAAYGSSANQINLSTRSGTNSLHGTVYEFNRNDAFDAKNYFDQPSAKKPILRQNQYGYSLGGPFFVPKLYDGRNRSFFFANFERLKAASQQTVFGIVPTADQLSGKFKTPIQDPNAPGMFFPQDGAGNYVVPASRFSRLGKIAAAKYFAAPNTNQAQGNFVGVIPTPTIANQQTYRGDQKLGSKDTLTGRVTLTDTTITSSTLLTPTGDENVVYQNHGYEGIETHTFSPKAVNQFIFGWLDTTSNTVGVAANPADIAALGMQNTYSQSGAAFPNLQFKVGGFSAAGGADNVPLLRNQTSYNINDSLSLTLGTQTITTGFDLRHYRITSGVQTGDNPLGQYGFDGSFTSPRGTLADGDNAIADLLLGWPQGGTASLPTAFAPTTPFSHIIVSSFAPFINDDWKVNDRLTLNLGLRYDYYAVPYEQDGHFFWLNPSIPGGGLYTSDKSIITSGIGSNLYAYGGKTAGSSPKLVFAPRFGFALRPFNDSRTVLRGGYGIFRDQFDISEYESVGYPFTLKGNAEGQNTDTLWSASIPGPVTPADLTFLELQPSVLQDPYVQTWSLSVERALASNTKLEVNYVGSKGTHLETRQDGNQPTPYDPANPTSGIERHPFKNLGTVIQGIFNNYSNYNALNITLDHRSHSLLLLAAYTWGKSLDDKSSSAGSGTDVGAWFGPMDSANPSLDYGRSTFDLSQRLVTSFVYDLPVGKGQRFGSGANRAVDLLIGGWQANGIATFQTGFPFSVTGDDIGSLLETYGQRADAVGQPYPSGFHRNINHWFNTGAFVQPAPGVYGTSGRNILNAPRLDDFDLSFFKNVPIWERMNFQFRTEMFNAFNHPHLGCPGQDVNSTNFGVLGCASPGRIIQFGGKVTF